MILDDRHIAYLTAVDSGVVGLRNGRYVLIDHFHGFHEILQTVAIGAELLGLTRIAPRASGVGVFVTLTDRGVQVLIEESEQW